MTTSLKDSGPESWCWCQRVIFQILSLPLLRCVFLGKSLSLSDPHSASIYMKPCVSGTVLGLRKELSPQSSA